MNIAVPAIAPSRVMGEPPQIAIAGNMGSGKTTLARVLCNAFDLKHLPEPMENGYLLDLFTSPERWAFEAQVAFLTRKAVSLVAAHREGRGVVVERSLFEDIDVFARLFKNRGHIDERAFETYSYAAHLTVNLVPPPRFVLYCQCSVAECERRVIQRGKRPFEELFPEHHFEDVGALYEQWLGTFNAVPVFVLNTQTMNLLDSEIQVRVCKAVSRLLGGDSTGEEDVELLEGR